MAFIFAGIFWHGITEATLQRFWHDVIARPGAPMRFQFILQPLMAAAVAIHDGLKDARTGRSPYFWTMLRSPHERTARLKGLNATARIILIGLLMDIIYQLLVLKEFYPNESVVIAVLLAFLRYVILRGPVRRIAGRSQARLLRGPVTQSDSADLSPTRPFEVRVTSDSHFGWIRTRFSVERTMMAWLRTATALIGFGFAIVQFFPPICRGRRCCSGSH